MKIVIRMLNISWSRPSISNCFNSLAYVVHYLLNLECNIFLRLSNQVDQVMLHFRYCLGKIDLVF